jgi:hypothetical protein
MSPIVAVCRLNWPWIIPRSLSQVVHKIQIKYPYNCGIDFVFLHVISQCPISHFNIVVYIYHFHLSLIHSWIQIQVSKCSSMHSHSLKPRLAMKSFLCPPYLFLTYNIWRGSCPFCIYHFFTTFLLCGMWTFMAVNYWCSTIWLVIVYLNSHSL